MDKTYMDDKGYMVTKKEYESASESDTEEQEKKPEKITPKKHKKVEAPLAKKSKLTGSGGKGQTGIMNFFKKK